MNGVADGTLARQAASGDRAAFAALYDRFNGEIYGFSLRLLSNPSDAADVTQDVFVRAIEKLAQLREPDRVRAWLFTIARHECFARTKRRGRSVATDPIDLAADMASTSRSTVGVAEANELTKLVWDAAKGLAPEDRAVLDLKLKRDLDGADLAEALGVPHDQLHKVTGRAMERFERSIVSLVLARGARRDCSVLAGLVETDDVELTPVLRKRIARHAQDCDACERRRKILVNPSTMVASAHEAGPSVALRDRVLEAAFSHSLTGTSALRSLSWRADGFPKVRSGLRKFVMIAALAGLLVGGLFASGVGSNDDPKPIEVQQSGSPASTFVSPVSTAVASTSIPDAPTTTFSVAFKAVAVTIPVSSTTSTVSTTSTTIASTTIASSPVTSAPAEALVGTLVTASTRSPVPAATRFVPPSTRLRAPVEPSIPLGKPSSSSTLPVTTRKPKPSPKPTPKPRPTTTKPSPTPANPTIPPAIQNEDSALSTVESTVPVSTVPPIIYPESFPADPTKSASTQAPQSVQTIVPSSPTTTLGTTPTTLTQTTTTQPAVSTSTTSIAPAPAVTTTTLKCALTQAGCGSQTPTPTTTTISIRVTPICCITINPGILFATTTKPPVIIK